MSHKRIRHFKAPYTWHLSSPGLGEILQRASAREPALLPPSADTSGGFMLKFPILTPFGIESAAKMTDFSHPAIFS